MLQPVPTEQGGSTTRDNEEVELVLLVLVDTWTVITPRTEIFSPVYVESLAEEGRRGGLASGVQSLSYVFLLIIDRVALVSTSMVVSALLSVTEISIGEEGDRVAGE